MNMKNDTKPATGSDKTSSENSKPAANKKAAVKTKPVADKKQSANKKNVQQKLAQSKKSSQLVKKIQQEASLIPQNYEKEARKRRRSRSISLLVRFAAFVVLPTIAAAFYYLLTAVNQYESVSSFVVQSSESNSGASIDSIIGTLGSSSASTHPMTIQKYILSRDMLSRLNEEHKFVAHYQQDWIDPMARLPRDATMEDAYEYYLDHVEALYDSESRALTLNVKAFSAKSARRFAEAILKYAEEKVNSISDKMQQDQIRFAAKTVGEAEKRLEKAQKAMLALQRERSEFNPMQSAIGLTTVKEQLKSELATTMTELNQLRAVMAPMAPAVLGLQRKVQSLRRQIKKEDEKLLGKEDDGLPSSIQDFEMAMLEKEFAQKEYETTMVSLKLAKLEAMKQSRYLSVLDSPSEPDEALYPERGKKILTVFLMMLAIFGIFSLLGSAVREHARI